MSHRVIVAVSLLAGAWLSVAAAPADIPHRKAGWWEMSMHLPGGRVMVRNLCLDATSDIRNNVLAPADGCTMDAKRLPNGYSYRKMCGSEVTTGSAIGDFNSNYKISETRGRMSVQTDARWKGPCPAGKKADQMWMRTSTRFHRMPSITSQAGSVIFLIRRTA